jgi:hypothetical protein
MKYREAYLIVNDRMKKINVEVLEMLCCLTSSIAVIISRRFKMSWSCRLMQEIPPNWHSLKAKV